MKIVLDTNVLISAFITEGTSKDVLDAALGRAKCIISPYILDEFHRILRSKKFGFPKNVVDMFESYLTRHCELSHEDPKISVRSPDPNDQKILALCHTVNADFLITGDEELLALVKTGSTQIIRPSQFWKAIKNNP